MFPHLQASVFQSTCDRHI